MAKNHWALPPKSGGSVILLVEKLAASSYTPLFITIVLGALALTGAFSVTAARVLLAAAWLVAMYGLRWLPIQLFVTFGAILGGSLVILAFVFRPDVVPAYTGVLTPKAELLFSPTEGGLIPKIQIGTSNTFFTAGTAAQSSAYGAMLLPMLQQSQFKVESIGGKMKISTLITDDKGNVIAELIRNEWKVAPPPNSWDRNYTSDRLEVRDAKGHVVLQVHVLLDRIQIQGAWWINMGPPNGLAQVFVMKNPHPSPVSQALIVFVPKNSLQGPPTIAPMFAYPSERHLGELLPNK